MIDVLSNGRLRLGIGMGYREEEFDALGVSKKTRYSRTLETVEIRARGVARPSASRASISTLATAGDSRPASKPSGAGAGRDDFDQGHSSAPPRQDMGFACNLGRHQIEIYRKAMRDRGKDPSKYSLVNSRIVYVADDEEKAWKDIEQAAMYQAGLYGKWLSAASPGQNWIQPDAKQLRVGAIIGNPETVRAKIAEVIESASPTELIINMQLPGLAPTKAMRSLERFTFEVLPRSRYGGAYWSDCRIEFSTNRNMRGEITTPSRFTCLRRRSSAGVTLFCLSSARLSRNCFHASLGRGARGRRSGPNSCASGWSKRKSSFLSSPSTSAMLRENAQRRASFASFDVRNMASLHADFRSQLPLSGSVRASSALP